MKAGIPVEDIYQRLCMLQMKIGRMRHRIIDKRIQELGVHPGQHFMLVQLKRMGRTPSQAKLAEEMNVSPALVARTLKALEGGGYIARADSAADGRRNEIAITEKGAEALLAGKRIVDALDGRSFEGFSREELETLHFLLGKLHDNIARIEQAEKEMRQN